MAQLPCNPPDPVPWRNYVTLESPFRPMMDRPGRPPCADVTFIKVHGRVLAHNLSVSFWRAIAG